MTADNNHPEAKERFRQCIAEMRLEAAIALVGNGVVPKPNDFDPIIDDCRRRARRAERNGEIGEAIRFRRRVFALVAFRDRGPDPAAMIADCDLTPGYDGKILLVRIHGGVIDRKICIRSGDDWHREILANTRAEISDLGFPSATVRPLGGAHAQTHANGRRLSITGTSDDFGACDRALAAEVIARAFPGTDIITRD